MTPELLLKVEVASAIEIVTKQGRGALRLELRIFGQPRCAPLHDYVADSPDHGWKVMQVWSAVGLPQRGNRSVSLRSFGDLLLGRRAWVKVRPSCAPGLLGFEIAQWVPRRPRIAPAGPRSLTRRAP